MSLRLSRFLKQNSQENEPPHHFQDRLAEIRQNRIQTGIIRKVNRAFLVLLILGGLAVVIYGRMLYIHDFQRNMKKLDTLTSLNPQPLQPRTELTPRESVELDAFDRRNIFARYQVQEKKENRASTKDANKFKNSIRVVGITFDKDYEVLVEDLNKKETILLTRGDTVAGATLVEISDNKLVFELDDNRIELEP